MRERARDGEGDLPRFPAASFDGVLQAGKKKTSIFVFCVSLSLFLSLSSLSLSPFSLPLYLLDCEGAGATVVGRALLLLLLLPPPPSNCVCVREWMACQVGVSRDSIMRTHIAVSGNVCAVYQHENIYVAGMRTHM